MDAVRERFYGLMACLCTEFRDDGSLDTELLAENTQKLGHSGTHGIYCMGATGEGYNISDAEFQQVVDIFVQYVPSSVVRIVGCYSPNMNQTLERARQAQAKGADAILFIPPYFVPLNRRERLRCFELVASECPDLGIVHYNTGNAPNVRLDADDYAELQAIPNFWGSKQTFISFEDWMEFRRRSPDIVHMPLDFLFVPSMMYGGRGIFSELPTLSPRFALELWNACIDKDWVKAVELHTRWTRFSGELYGPLHEQGYSYIALDKAFYNACGFMRTLPPRPPLDAVPPEVIRQVRQKIQERYPEFIYA
jgi:4-hydroxy-tetrahydrodipicolinate synthase